MRQHPRFDNLNDLMNYVEKEAERRAKIAFEVKKMLDKSKMKPSINHISKVTGFDSNDVEYALEFLQGKDKIKTSKESEQKLSTAEENKIELLERRVKDLEDKFEKLKEVLSS